MPLTPTKKKTVRSKIASYCLRAEANERHWHYSQQRPYRFVDNPDSRWVVADCSSYVAIVFHDAMHDTGIYLADPLGMRYTGYGYTGTMLDWLDEHGKRAPAGKYLVGDIALWGPSWSRTTHTAVCRKSGTAITAVWSSHGNEGSPEPVKLHYHPDPLIGVWRHPALL